MKNITKLITAALGTICLASCGNNVPKTEEKNFPGTGYIGCDFSAVKELNKHVVLGQKSQLNLSVLPTSYTNKLVFEPKDSSVVSVSESGEMTGLAKGTTTVNIKNADGKLVGVVNVIVTDGEDTGVVDTISSIGAAYADPSYKAPKKVHKLEYSHEIYYRNGNINHGLISYEETYFDENAYYFMISGDDISVYAENGAPSVGTGKWIFQVQGMKTRMVHITDNAKTYFDFNSGKYDDDAQVIYDLLDMFFVSGREIVDNMLDDYSGKSDFEHYAPYYPDEGMELHADGKNNLYMNLAFQESGNVVKAEDEIKYVDMFEGTKYDETDYVSYIYTGAKCSGFSIHAIYDYEIDGSKWNRDFVRSMLFDENYVIEEYKGNDEEMKLDGWTKADNMYDL